MAKREAPEKNVIAEYLQLIVSVVIIVVVVRSFIFEPFRIPSPSMDPTLKTGDYVIVTKFSYGFGRQSIFDIPLISDRIFWREPKRGNVVVFADPDTPRQKKLVKRVVGVPGDVIEMRNSLLYINGEPAERELIGPGSSNADRYDRRGQEVESMGDFFLETFESQNGKPHEHIIWDKYYGEQLVSPDIYGPFTVPEDHLFFMGDNRDNSADSRDRSLGVVHRKYIMGRAQFVLFSLNIQQVLDQFQIRNSWNLANPFRWGRFFKGIR